MSLSSLKRVAGIRDGETRAVLLSCLYFFFVLSAYYILRPLREEMGLAGGVRNLPWLFLCTLGAMFLATPLFGALVNRYPRRIFLPATYWFFTINLLVFFVMLRSLSGGSDILLGRIFYVWISVFNMFAVSLFWAFMADGFGFDRSKRLFGLIAIGGTLGAVVGARITAELVGVIGRPNLILVSMALLIAAILCVRSLNFAFANLAPETADSDGGEDRARGGGKPGSNESAGGAAAGGAAAGESGMNGGILNGIRLTLRSPYLLGISAFLFLYSLSSTFLYFEQANIVAGAVADRAARAALFARIDFWVNLITLITQIAFTGRIIRRFGVSAALAVLPVLTAVGFLALGLAPALTVLIIFQVARRAANYALVRPARETLFTILPLEEKYKAKSFIDTFVYRGGDALGASAFDLLTKAGLGLAGIAFTAVPIAVAWGAVGVWLGIAQRRRLDQRPDPVSVSP